MVAGGPRRGHRPGPSGFTRPRRRSPRRAGEFAV